MAAGSVSPNYASSTAGPSQLSEPKPALSAGSDWPYPHIHTLNRSGPLKVIDGIAAVPKKMPV
jgi:hypothetical protein